MVLASTLLAFTATTAVTVAGLRPAKVQLFNNSLQNPRPNTPSSTTAATTAPLSRHGHHTGLRIFVSSVTLPSAPGSPLPSEFSWLINGSWVWGAVTSGAAVSQQQLEATWAAGVVPLCDIRASKSSRNREANNHHIPPPNLTAVLSMHVKAAAAAGRSPSDVIWKAFEEDDSAGVAFPWEFMAAGLRVRRNTSAQARAVWEAHLTEAIAEATPWVNRGLQLWGRSGFSMTPHSLARRGVRTVLVERANDDVGDLLPAVAFARGAVAQFAIDGWGLDLSQWWGPINGCVLRLPALYHRRHLYATMAAGASVLGFEGCGWLNSSGQPYPLARELDFFGRFAKRESTPDRLGTPDTPVAVLLPSDHGWTAPPYWATSTDDVYWSFARLSRPVGMRGVDGVFGAAFPGAGFSSQPYPFGAFESDAERSPSLGFVPPQWTPTPDGVFYTAQPLPFGQFRTRTDAASFMTSGTGVETSPYRPMADTRWGAILDALTDDASAQVLQRYRVLIIAGPVNVTQTLMSRLEAFVRGGGSLVWSVGVATPTHGALTGLNFTGELLTARAWRWLTDAKRGHAVHEPLLYTRAEPLSATDNNVTVLSATPSGDPLVVRHTREEWHGGTVFTVTVPWLEGAAQTGGASLAGPVMMLLDEVIGAVQPVLIDGLPVQWHSSTVRDARGSAIARTVTILNNDAVDWRGNVTLPGLSTEGASCQDLRKQTSTRWVPSVNGLISVEVSVPANDVAVFRCGLR